MAAPLIAIVGGADPERAKLAPPEGYRPPVNIATANDMAHAVGAELARRGHRMLVYHGGGAFIEGKAIEGFVSTNPSTEKAILVRQPQMGTPSIFAQELTHPHLFERWVDTSEEWEVSFYRSLAGADGVVVIGGGYSTFTAGQVAIGSRIPILALEKSGGSAASVWKTLSPGVDLPTSDEHARMAHALTDEAVRGWVDSLTAQGRRRYAFESGPIRKHAIYAGLLFVLALITALASHLVPRFNATPLATALLIASTLLGGGAGAAIRMVFERRYGTGPLVPPSLAVTMALGTMAGGLAGLLYLVAQTTQTDLSEEGALRFVSIMAIISVIGGLTVETVFRKLLGVDVVHTNAIAAPPDGQAPPPRATKS